MQAAKAVDFCGCLPDHVIEAVDAEQAYIQAEIKVTLLGSAFPQKHAPIDGEISFQICVVLCAVY